MSLADFRYRQQIRDRFATAIHKSKKQILVDEHGLLTEVEKPVDKQEDEKKEKKEA